ncbi:MinD/ParA family ATP-binding protein [Arthrobacter sp. zg-Y750]|uniref:MinD/ParA family ATP-binding protein n=1 Tax=Arthrobacter sp. zg-Y750 TaxID=2894189 RepID=UPI001E5A6D3A|nr:ATPase [Arthrobacter sp. zg-Y750]MCC9176387.1 ATPase [Arthrobacter sp. zg-Y750]
MTEHFPHPNERPDDLPSRRRRRAGTVPGSEAEWWNSPPQGAEAGAGVTGNALNGSSSATVPGEAWDEYPHGMGGSLTADDDGAAGGGGDFAVAGTWDAGSWDSPAAGAIPAVAPLPPLPVSMPEPPAEPAGWVERLGGGEPDTWAEPLGGAALEANQPGSRAEARAEHGRHGGRRASFLDQQPASIPASKGFRGLLTGLGLRLAPSAQELEERRAMRAVSQHWPGPRTVSVVNGKGGANKTPTTVMLAAVFARNGGGPVLAWDNNETRGTLGWRTEQGPHESTVMDLLPQTADLLSPSAQSALLARFVHHQVEDKFDVLRSKPDVLASEQKITAEDFDALHEVASKYFRLNIVDSGNDESAERWLRMIDHTDQLVIATTTVEEHAEAGALLLEALQVRGGRYAELARDAVVIVSQSDRNGTDSQARRVAEGFGQLARAAVTIPYDPALRKGQIRYDSLKPAAQRAWLAAAAAVAEGL